MPLFKTDLEYKKIKNNLSNYKYLQKSKIHIAIVQNKLTSTKSLQKTLYKHQSIFALYSQ